jgi:hypothetical protein
MASGFVAVAIWVFAVFAAGAAIGVVVAVAVAIRREDRRQSLRTDTQDWLARGARRVNGVGVRNEAERKDKEPVLH